MRPLRTRFGFPVLTRDLKGLSARSRMFVLRTTFAAVFLGFVFWRTKVRLGWTMALNSTSALGSGAAVFEELTQWLVVAVGILMPVITAGAIVEEKERDTLTTLLTTQVSAGQIIIEKLLSRVWVMITLLLVSMPLLAFAYSLGGIDQRELTMSIIALSVFIVSLGSLSLYWSVRCSSVVAAFVSTLFSAFALAVPFSCCIEPRNHVVALAFLSGGGVIVTAFSLGRATSRLHDAATTPVRNQFFRQFKRYDTFFADAGLWVVRERRTLPDDEPVAWRETKKRALSRTQHLVHVFLALETPLFFLLLPAIMGQGHGISYRVTQFLWLISALVLTLRTASVVPGERVRQTFPILLATPITGREIVNQYMDGVRRPMLALAIPLLTVYVATSMLLMPSVFAVCYLIGCCLTLVVLMPLATWIPMLISLRARTQLGAVVGSVLLMTGWIFIPGIVIDRPVGPEGLRLNLFFSPTWMMELLPRSVHPHQPGVPDLMSPQQLAVSVLSGAVFYGGILLLVRARCLRNADRYLGRLDSSSADDSRCSSSV